MGYACTMTTPQAVADDTGAVSRPGALPPPELLQLLTDHIGSAVSVIDKNLHFRYVNATFARWFGVTAEQLVGTPIRQFYGEHNHARYMPYLQRALNGETVNYERAIRDPAGGEGWWTVSLTPWCDAQGQLLGIVSSSLNVHELKVTMEALRVANQRLSSHMDNSPLVVVEMDAALNITYCSPRVALLFGWEPGELTGLSMERLLSGDEEQEILRIALTRLQNGEESRNRVEARHRRKDGSLVHCGWFNSALTDANGKVASIMALIEDVSARVLAAERLRYIATHDALTGLPNRNEFQSRVEHSLVRASRTGTTVALLFIDLDGFKAINDAYGHAAGDLVLQEAAARLTGAVRDCDTVARLGGDEFVVLLDTLVASGTAAEVSERILRALSTPIALPQGEACIGASIGIAAHPPLESHAERLIKRADAAMYEAKRAGKGCVRQAPFEPQP
jgi:diguanylate cyclase (GGDEF)-like protein/PAS domain S-box-containing protein